MSTETEKTTWTRWFVQRDGADISPARNTENAAWTWIMDHQGLSVDWAIKYEGYKIVSREVPIAEPELGWDEWICLDGFASAQKVKIDAVYQVDEDVWVVTGLDRESGKRQIAITDRQNW